MFLGGYYCGKLLRWEKATLQQVTFDLRPVNIYLFVSWKRVNPLKCYLAWTLQKLQTPFWRRKLASIQIFMCFDMKLKFSCHEIIFDNFFFLFEKMQRRIIGEEVLKRWIRHQQEDVEKFWGNTSLSNFQGNRKSTIILTNIFFRLIICQMNSTCLT